MLATQLLPEVQQATIGNLGVSVCVLRRALGVCMAVVLAIFWQWLQQGMCDHCIGALGFTM
eukprot:6786622-Karenia_brevis.AAC.1